MTNRPSAVPVPLDCAVCGRPARHIYAIEAEAEPNPGLCNSWAWPPAQTLVGWDLEPCGHRVQASLYTLEVRKGPPATAAFIYNHSPHTDEGPAPAGP